MGASDEEGQKEASAKRLLELCMVLRGCQEHGHSYRTINSFEPSSTSVLKENQSDAVYGKDCAEALRSAFLRLSVVEDLLVGVARLLNPPVETVFPQMILPRSIAEAAARGAYLVDPDVGAKERAARHLNDRLNTLNRNIALAMDPDDKARLAKRREQVWDDAQSRGHTIKINKNGEKVYIDAHWPNATELLGWLFQDDEDSPLGAVIHRFYSQVMHVTPGGLLGEFEVGDEADENDVHLAVPAAKHSTLELIVAVSLLSWALAMDKLILATGWEPDPWIGWRKKVFDTARPGVAGGSPDGE